MQDVRLDPDGRRAWRGDVELSLSRKEFDLLHTLMSRAGHLVTRAELMSQVWHTTFYTSSKTIDVHLGWLRRKLGDDPRRPTLITTLRGRGLRFEQSGPAPREAALEGAVEVPVEVPAAIPAASGGLAEAVPLDRSADRPAVAATEAPTPA